MKRITFFALLVLLFAIQSTVAQDRFKFGGLAVMDYYYNVSNVDPAKDDLNGFTYRRLYLTADYKITPSVGGRVRLESSDSNLGTRGTIPWVKDLYVTYTTSTGHSLTGGITPNPGFQVSEEAWGYRSLDQTVIERFGVLPSRDFGLLVRGPLTGDKKLRYSAMLGNNNGVFPENNKHKRVYGQLEAYPTENVILTVGSDYQTGVNDYRYLLFNGFLGYVSKPFRIGLEGFIAPASDALDGGKDRGIGGWLVVNATPKVSLIARYDVGAVRGQAPGTLNNVGIFAIAWQPVNVVRIMPNLHLLQYNDREQASITPRLTLEARF